MYLTLRKPPMVPCTQKGGIVVVSMQDIADKAGVSRVTVSRVLSNHPSVKAETRQKVLHWVKELDYEPNLIAQSLAGNRTNIIGLLVPEIAYPFFSEIIESIENQAFYEGYSVIICNTHRSLEKEKNILAQLRQRKVDGVIAVPVSTKRSLPAYQRLQIPAVMITKRLEGFSSVYLPLSWRSTDCQTFSEYGISENRVYRPHQRIYFCPEICRISAVFVCQPD